jgi:hypothetical protein
MVLKRNAKYIGTTKSQTATQQNEVCIDCTAKLHLSEEGIVAAPLTRLTRWHRDLQLQASVLIR